MSDARDLLSFYKPSAVRKKQCSHEESNRNEKGGYNMRAADGLITRHSVISVFNGTKNDDIS